MRYRSNILRRAAASSSWPIEAHTSAVLLSRIETNPLDFEARFDLAVALNAGGQREAAVDQLVAIIKANRGWNDEAARKQLLTFFEAWGPTDPFTVEARRRLSTVLFS